MINVRKAITGSKGFAFALNNKELLAGFVEVRWQGDEALSIDFWAIRNAEAPIYSVVVPLNRTTDSP